MIGKLRRLDWSVSVFLDQLDSLERNETELNTITEKKLAHQLRDVTEATARLYGNDLQIAERLLSRLLTFETQQSGFGLTATQDAHFNEVKKTFQLPVLYHWINERPVA